jgi:hypothetical protein
MMTKKHFEAIAEAVASVREHPAGSITASLRFGIGIGENDRISDRHLVKMIDLVIWDLVSGLADVCEGENENFDRDKFYAACAK